METTEKEKTIILELEKEYRIELMPHYRRYKKTVGRNKEHKKELERQRKEEMSKDNSPGSPFKSDGFSPYCISGYVNALY